MDTTEQKILQKRLARFIIDEVFNTITEDDLLRIERSGNPTKPDIWRYKGEELPQANIEVLKAQAKTLLDSELWKILSNELRWTANQKGLMQSQTSEDILASKLLLYLTDVIESKLKSMSH